VSRLRKEILDWIKAAQAADGEFFTPKNCGEPVPVEMKNVLRGGVTA
jgi:hypothetical protein